MPSDAPVTLNRLGQSLWLDNITRDLLDSGTLQRYIDTLSVTGLTSNPTIFDHAISRSDFYDAEIHRQLDEGRSGEALFFHLAVQDLTRAADVFAPVHARTATVDGFVSLEVSPLLAYDTSATVKQAKALHAQANRPNLFIKIPGTKEGLPAIEEAIFAGVPVNVTLLFSADQYKAAADAYPRRRRQRLHALAFHRQHQPKAIILQRLRTVSMTNHIDQPIDIILKRCFNPNARAIHPSASC